MSDGSHGGGGSWEESAVEQELLISEGDFPGLLAWQEWCRRQHLQDRSSSLTFSSQTTGSSGAVVGVRLRSFFVSLLVGLCLQSGTRQEHFLGRNCKAAWIGKGHAKSQSAWNVCAQWGKCLASCGFSMCPQQSVLTFAV